MTRKAIGKKHNLDIVKELIENLSGQSNCITVPRMFVQMLDHDFPAALLLNQITFWSSRGWDEEWIHKSYRVWDEEICLSQYQVKRAADKLEKMGLIQRKTRLAACDRTEKEKAEKKELIFSPTIHYKLLMENLKATIIKFLDNEETQQSDCEVSQQSDYQETSQSLITEITSKNITDNSAQKTGAYISSLDALEEANEIQKPEPKQDDHPEKRAKRASKIGLELLPAWMKPFGQAFLDGLSQAGLNCAAYLPTEKTKSKWTADINDWSQIGVKDPELVKRSACGAVKAGWDIYSPGSITSYIRKEMGKTGGAVQEEIWHSGMSMP